MRYFQGLRNFRDTHLDGCNRHTFDGCDGCEPSCPPSIQVLEIWLELLRSWLSGILWTIFFFYLIYPPLVQLILTSWPPHFTQTYQTSRPLWSAFTSIVHLCVLFHIHRFIQLTYLNALFHLLLFRIMDPRSFTNMLSCRPSFVDIPVVYKETPP